MYTVDIQELEDFVELLDIDPMVEVIDLDTEEKVHHFVQELLSNQGQEGLDAFKEKAQPIMDCKCVTSLTLPHTVNTWLLFYIIRLLL